MLGRGMAMGQLGWGEGGVTCADRKHKRRTIDNIIQPERTIQ